MYTGFSTFFCKALDIRIKAYGPDHKDVGQTLLSYSAFLLRVDPKRSAEVAKQAAEIFEVKCINELIFSTSACVEK